MWKKFTSSENTDPHANMFSAIQCWVLTLRYQDYPVTTIPTIPIVPVPKIRVSWHLLSLWCYCFLIPELKRKQKISFAQLSWKMRWQNVANIFVDFQYASCENQTRLFLMNITWNPIISQICSASFYVNSLAP